MVTLISNLQPIWEKNWPELHAATTGGLPQFIIARHASDLGSSVPVFCYHVVNAESFEADLDFLSRNGYVPIDADALLDHLEERRKAPKNAVVLTFDDGARNLYDIGFPLLQRYGMRAVAFVATRFHREESEEALDDKTQTERELCSPLSWSQIREMHASGVIDFQSHTHEHRYIPRWPEPAGLEGSATEIVRSLRGPGLTIAEDFTTAKQLLEQKLGKTVVHLAFPKFSGTSAAVAIARNCGYRALWWGMLPGRSGNRAGDLPCHIVRLKSEFLRRLPGEGRLPLSKILRKRYRARIRRFFS